MAPFEDFDLRKNPKKLFSSRAAYSSTKLEVLTSQLAKAKHPKFFKYLTIYAAGSYGRLEASKYSDIDLFFVLAKPRAYFDEIRVPEIRLLSEIVEIGYNMSFPKFSNDGHFLKLLFLDDILDNLGSPADDYHNHFTARMLLLLESKPIYGPDIYNRLLKETVESYFRDYPHHPTDFRPTFLTNDILRFWKTLCLNYEHKRNQIEGRDKTKHKVKNFKLGFSRLMTCFATVAMLSTYRETISPRNVTQICHMTPTERLIAIGRRYEPVQHLIFEILDMYNWFLAKTALPTEQLERYFSFQANRTEAFGKARLFGNKMFDLLRLLDEQNHNLRYLVV
jgi:hypothetical protein